MRGGKYRMEASRIVRVVSRFACVFGLVLSLSNGSKAASPIAVQAEELPRIFAEASAEFDVPSQILEAIAFVESRWTISPRLEKLQPQLNEFWVSGIDSSESHQRSFTLMGLRDDAWFGRSLLQAARLIGQDPRALLNDPRLAIRGAAAYLRSLSRDPRLGIELAIKRQLARTQAERLAAWSKVVSKYSGIPTPEDARDYVGEVYRTLNRGAQTRSALIVKVDGVFDPALISLPVSAWDSTPGTGDPGLPKGAEYPKAIWDPSPNIDRNGLKARQIVIHTTQGSFAGAVSWLKNPSAKVSSHYVIRSSDGFVKQLVRESDKAWHARCWNPRTIGIEHEAYMESPDYFTEAMLESSADLVAYLSNKHQIPADGLNVFGHNFWSRPEFKQSELYRDGLICNNHGDPGKFWDWTAFMARVQNHLSSSVR
jgi:hypothetical protein